MIPACRKSCLERDMAHVHGIVMRSEYEVSCWPAVIQRSCTAYHSHPPARAHARGFGHETASG